MRYYFRILIFFVYGTSLAQNLVPNANFTLYSSCPTSPIQFQYLMNWYSPSVLQSTPDFFHQCAGTIPLSSYFYQYDHTGGGGMAGIIAYEYFTSGREYIQVELTDSLRYGHKYCIEYFVVRAEAYDMAISDMGAYLSDSAMYLTSNTNFTVTPNIENPSSNMLTDTVNWIRINGMYTAHGGEKFLTIGNFRDTSSSHAVLLDSSIGFYYAYYLIDDVRIINCDSVTSLYEISNIDTISLYPNPSTDAINITSHQSIISINILNMFGCNVFERYNTQNKTTIEISTLPNGIYFVQIKTDYGIAVKKFVKQ